ncbi:hypothetical protein C8R46DRAFT_1123603 [Mycena filopes]|nr:hypothetical protein C8R46DRAFT_1123603 [Mycena filopes]
MAGRRWMRITAMMLVMQPSRVDGNAQRRKPSVIFSSVELKDSTLETEERRRLLVVEETEDRRRLVVEVDDANVDTESTDEIEDLRDGVSRSQVLRSPGIFASAAAGMVIARLNDGFVVGEMSDAGGGDEEVGWV